METFASNAERRAELAASLTGKSKFGAVHFSHYGNMEFWLRGYITAGIRVRVAGSRTYAMMVPVSEIIYSKERLNTEKHLTDMMRSWLRDKLSRNDILTRPKGKLPD